jgi:hypothetical protein
VSLTDGTPIGSILGLAMRRFALLSLLVALLVPAAAYAVRNAPGDGTLSVRNGEGMVNLSVRGVIIGRFDSGRLVVHAPRDGDCDLLEVWGATREKPWTDEDGVVYACQFFGRNIRFRFVGGQHVIRIGRPQVPARDIDLSVVGRGTAHLKGATGLLDGVYSRNGEPYQPLPGEGLSFRIGAPAATPGG